MKIQTGILASVLALFVGAAGSYGATIQTVAFGGGNPSTEGWTVVTGAGVGGEFNNGSEWALFGPSEATRTLGGGLFIGQSVSIDFASLGVIGGDFVGVDFRQGTTTGIGYNFEGGGSNYGVFSNAGVADAGIGFTTDLQTITLTNVDGTNYSLDVGGTVFGSLALANGATAIDGIRLFNETSGGGNDVLFNNLVVDAIPEPTAGLLAAFGGLLLFRRRRR